MSENSKPPGWYHLHGQQWYWDGQQWSAVGPSPFPPRNNKVLKWLGIAALVLLFLGMCGAYIAKDDSPPVAGPVVTQSNATASNGLTRKQFFSTLESAWNDSSYSDRESVCKSWRESPELRNMFIDSFIEGAELDGSATDQAWLKEHFNTKCSTT